MTLILTLYTTLLFIIMTPGVLFTLPKIKKTNVLISHALLFAVIYYFTHNIVLDFSVSIDGFAESDLLSSKAWDKRTPKPKSSSINRQKLNKPKKSLATTKLDYDRQIAADEAKAKAFSQQEYYQMQQRMFNSDLDAWNRNMALEKEGKSSRLMDSRTGKAVEQPVFQRT